MTERQNLRMLTYDAFEWLYSDVDNLLEHYADESANFDKVFESSPHAGKYSEPIPHVYVVGDLKLKPPKDVSSKKRHEADSQALKFYKSFEGMTPRLASDPLVLAYINHFYLHEYGISRWPFEKGMTNKARIKKIRKHWLTRSTYNTDIYQSSIAGRTWWIARTAIVVAEHSRGELKEDAVLKKFANYAEYYHRVMQYSIFRNPLVMFEFVRSLFHEAKDATIEEYILMARDMNLKAGARLIDSLDRMQIRLMVREAAESRIGGAST